MKITDKIDIEELKQMSQNFFGDFVKAVIDIEKNLIAIDSELHSDLEEELLKSGSKQQNLWGINLYPFATKNEFVEFDSMINIKPHQNNRSRYVEGENIREQIISIIENARK